MLADTQRALARARHEAGGPSALAVSIETRTKNLNSTPYRTTAFKLYVKQDATILDLKSAIQHLEDDQPAKFASLAPELLVLLAPKTEGSKTYAPFSAVAEEGRLLVRDLPEWKRSDMKLHVKSKEWPDSTASNEAQWLSHTGYHSLRRPVTLAPDADDLLNKAF